MKRDLGLPLPQTGVERNWGVSLPLRHRELRGQFAFDTRGTEEAKMRENPIIQTKIAIWELFCMDTCYKHLWDINQEIETFNLIICLILQWPFHNAIITMFSSTYVFYSGRQVSRRWYMAWIRSCCLKKRPSHMFLVKTPVDFGYNVFGSHYTSLRRYQNMWSVTQTHTP